MASTTSEKGLAAARKRDTEDRELDKEVIVSLMGMVKGRRWLYLKLAAAQLWHEDDNLDPYRMAYEKGRRNVGNALLDSITRYAPAMYVRMLEESDVNKRKLTEEEEDAV